MQLSPPRAREEIVLGLARPLVSHAATLGEQQSEAPGGAGAPTHRPAARAPEDLGQQSQGGASLSTYPVSKGGLIDRLAFG